MQIAYYFSGLKNASSKLQRHYVRELNNVIVEHPFSERDSAVRTSPREKEFVELAVLNASTVNEEWNNSDRDTLMAQQYLQMTSTNIEHIFQKTDQIVIVRGVAGIGKSTLIDNFILKWASNEVLVEENINFLFHFTCRKLNTIAENISIEKLFAMQFPEIFSNVSMDELQWLAPRVMIIVDGLDELQGIYSKKPCSTMLQHVYNLIDTKGNFLKNHRSIVCGRPKACEDIRSKLRKSKNIIKTVEVCGFNSENVQKYITRFFQDKKKKEEEAELIRQVIKDSNDLNVMASVPVFLSVICNVYSEGLVTHKIQSNTELYLYTCLVFVRNHLQMSSNHEYNDLFQLVDDEKLMKILISLAKLSAQTYMNDQVLFTDDDVRKLNCPIHLEQTGFIVKSSQNAMCKAVYQFRHLVLQEFLCSLYIAFTKDVKAFILNRELTSCTPTLLGLHRLMRSKDNELFTLLFENLTKACKSRNWLKNFRRSISGPREYENYIAQINADLIIPSSMIDGNILSIKLFFSSDENTSFLNKVYESKHVNNQGRQFESASLIFVNANCRKAIFLVQTLNIQHIKYLEYRQTAQIASWDDFPKDLLKLITMYAGGEKITTEITAIQSSPIVSCNHGRLYLNIDNPIETFTLSEEIKGVSKEFVLKLKKLSSKLSNICTDTDGNLIIPQILNVFHDLIEYVVSSRKTLYIEVDKKQKDSLLRYLRLAYSREDLDCIQVIYLTYTNLT